jgi:hypothetical protein
LCKMRLCEFLLPKHFRHTIGASRIHVAYYRKQGVLFAINGNRLDLCKLLKIWADASIFLGTPYGFLPPP